MRLVPRRPRCARRSRPQAGLRVVAHGRIDLFEPQGALQLYVESIQPAGFGDLTLRFEALKARLAAGGPVRRRPQAAAAAAPAHDRGHHQPDRRRLARHLPRPRAALAADPGRPRRGQVQGEEAPASIVAAFRRLERWIAAAARRGPARRRAGGHDPRPRRRLASRTSGRSTTSASSGRSSPTRSRCLRRRARGRRDAGRLRRRRPRADAVRRRRDRRPGPGRVAAGVPARPPDGSPAPARRPPRGRAAASSPRSVAPSTGSSPVAQLAAARERVGPPARSRDRGRVGAGALGDATGRASTAGRALAAARSSAGIDAPSAADRAARGARHGDRGARRPRPAGDARSRLRHRPARRRRRDRPRPGRGAAGTAPRAPGRRRRDRRRRSTTTSR